MILLATISLTIIIGRVLSQQSFKSGFRDYLQHQEKRRLEILSENLIETYKQKDSLDFLRGNHHLWFSFFRSSVEHFEPSKPCFRLEQLSERFFPLLHLKINAYLRKY